MRRRPGIAAALLGDPPVLIFDEPINGLDPEGIVWARALLRRPAAEGRTVFVSGHVMSEVEHAVGHLSVVGDGRLVADEPPQRFAARARAGSVPRDRPDGAASRPAGPTGSSTAVSRGRTRPRP